MSEQLFDVLGDDPRTAGSAAGVADAALRAAKADPVLDDDIQVSLLVMYELHYGGVEDVSDRWEWDVDLLHARALLEAAFERALRDLVGDSAPQARPADVAHMLFDMTAPSGKPGLAAYLGRDASREQWTEFICHRSIYQLKEADPHTWAIPRLAGRAKAALVEVQSDEYGGGRPGRMHAELFARLMRAFDLDDRFGAYVDELPALTLTWVNAMSLFGLHRRLRGAVVGHLAAYEMTSPLPCKLYAKGLRRLGFGPDATEFFDEHVEADSVHEQIAGRDLAGGLAEAEPELADDILFGAAAEMALDDMLADFLLSSWRSGRSTLRDTGLPRERGAAG